MTGIVSKSSPELSFWIGPTIGLGRALLQWSLGTSLLKPPEITSLGQFAQFGTRHSGYVNPF